MICKESKKRFKLFLNFFFFLSWLFLNRQLRNPQLRHFKKACIFSWSIVVQTEARQAFAS